MPSTYTHYRFGKDVLKLLPAQTYQFIENYRELYDIGLHGPDICLYYDPFTLNEVKKSSFHLHKSFADELFKDSATKIKASICPDAYKAYIIGFICHYALDSTCHPYIEKLHSLGEVSHAEFETDFDCYFMTKDSLDPMSYFPTHHIKPSEYNCEIIKLFFKSLSMDEIHTCLNKMIETHEFLHASTDERLKELYKLLESKGCFGPMHGLIMKPSPNPISGRYYLLFENLYNEAVPLGADLINEFVQYLDKGTDLSGKFHYTFGAGENWENLSLEL